MNTLNPNPSFDIAVEQPVAPVSSGAIGALSSLVGIAGSLGESKGSTTGSNNSALDRGLMVAAQKIKALRAQGKNDQARMMEARVITNYTASGGDIDKHEDVIRSITGRDPREFGNTPEEVALQDTLSSPEFQEALLGVYATHPDATDEERQNIALGNLSLKNGRAAQLEAAAFNWTQEGEAAFLGDIADFENQFVGALTLAARTDGEVTLEEAQQARLTFQAKRAQIEAQRPNGISNDEWSKVRSRLDQVGKTFELVENFAKPGNVSAKALSNLQRAVQAADLPDVDKNILTTILTAEPSTFTDLGVIPLSELESSFRALRTGVSPSVLRNPAVDTADPVVNKDLTSEQVYNDLKGATTGAGLAKNVTNPAVREGWAQAMSVGLANMSELGARGEWMTEDQYASVFSDSFFKQLSTLKNTDPDLHQALTARAQRTLTTSGSALQARINSQLSDYPVKMDTDGQLHANIPALIQTITPKQFEVLSEAAVAAYGGTEQEALTLMLRDDGMSLEGDELGRSAARSAYSKAFGDFESNGDRIQKLSGSMFVLMDAQERLTKDQPKGTPKGMASLVGLINKHEGAGNYDTLFGHSQNDKFAGVQVSSMTIAELSEFANVGGQYGQWVKGQVGRVATPMGKYQIVGTTLRETANAMGLSPHTVFNEQTQDAMFHYLATKAISGKNSMAAKRRALRNEWDGFKNVSDRQLNIAIAEFEGTPPPTGSYDTRESQLIGEAIQRNNEGAETLIEAEGTATAPFVSSRPSERPQAASVDVSEATPAAALPQGETTGSQAATEQARQSAVGKASELPVRTLEILGALGLREDEIPSFDNADDVEKANLKKGDYYIINGLLGRKTD